MHHTSELPLRRQTATSLQGVEARGHDVPALATLSNKAILGHLPTVGEDGTGAERCSAGRNGEREVERARTVDGDASPVEREVDACHAGRVSADESRARAPAPTVARHPNEESHLRPGEA
jgi:hypothetical protein